MAKCVKCGQPEYARWHFCSHGPEEPVCIDCDIELNKLALKFRFPRTWEKKLHAYIKQLEGIAR